MSRTSLHMPHRYRAVCHRPATGTRLLPNPFPPTILRINTHYKRCPRAERLRLRSDQSSSRLLHGRSPDKSRHALLQGSRLRISAPVEGHTYVADLVLAGESQQSDERRLKTNAPFKDSTVVTTGELPTTNAGLGSPLPSLRVVEHFWWSRPPHTENFSALLHILSEVRGKDSTVVTTGLLPTTNAGLGSPLPSLRVVEHFWWSGLPHTENFSGLVHIPSEVRGCSKAGFDVEHPLSRTTPIGTGVAAFLRNRPGPSIPFPSRFLRLSCGGRSQMRQGVNPFPKGQGPRSSGRTLPSLPLVHSPSRDDRPVALGVGAPNRASTPLPLPFTIPRLREESRTCPLTLPPHLTPPSKGAAY